MCIYIYIYTHTHQPPFSFQLTLLSLTLHLTVGPSSVTAGLNFLSLTLTRHSRSVMFYSYLLYAFLFKIILFYIYIYCIQSEMFVSYESHLPSKGTRNHMTSLPSTQTESLTPCLFHIIFVPKPSPCIHQGGGFVDSYYLKKD